MLSILRAGLTELGLDAGAAEPLAAFAGMVLERNRVMNLTAITDEVDFARLHLLDSAALLNVADFGGKRVVDVGTGADVGAAVAGLRVGKFRLSPLCWLVETSSGAT